MAQRVRRVATAANSTEVNSAVERPSPEMREPQISRGSEHVCESVLTLEKSTEGGSRTHTPSEGYGISNPAHGCRNVELASEVAAGHSFSGTNTGPKCGESVTTNENVERLGASTDHNGARADGCHKHDAGLARINAVWEDLPAVLKGAMLAIVDSVERRDEF